MIIEIPADVKDNSPHVARVVSNGARPYRAAEELASYRKLAVPLYGYTTYEWSEVNQHGQRITITWFADSLGTAVWMYETAHHTRVPCATHPAYFASRYVSITDENGLTTIAQPCCDDCVRMQRRSAMESGMTLNLSETLLIGQH